MEDSIPVSNAISFIDQPLTYIPKWQSILKTDLPGRSFYLNGF